MMERLERIVAIRGGGQVERCHTFRHFGCYDNARHQWGVAMLMWELWPEDFPRLGIHCLTHDVPEQWVSDITANLKAYLPENARQFLKTVESRIADHLRLPSTADLSELDVLKIKNCDSLELYLWCMEQIHLYGVQPVVEIIVQLDRFYDSGRVQLLPQAENLLSIIRLSTKSSFMPRVANVVENIVTEARR